MPYVISMAPRQSRWKARASRTRLGFTTWGTWWSGEYVTIAIRAKMTFGSATRRWPPRLMSVLCWRRCQARPVILLHRNDRWLPPVTSRGRSPGAPGTCEYAGLDAAERLIG